MSEILDLEETSVRGTGAFTRNDFLQIMAGSFMPTLGIYAGVTMFPDVASAFFLVFVIVLSLLLAIIFLAEGGVPSWGRKDGGPKLALTHIVVILTVNFLFGTMLFVLWSISLPDPLAMGNWLFGVLFGVSGSVFLDVGLGDS